MLRGDHRLRVTEMVPRRIFVLNIGGSQMSLEKIPYIADS
jgi:hypothetical protein